ncbi:MAG: leucine--tRNA ligase [Dehalococcoidia bacterium]|jgi:leucyl-tRNA synthetase|nr:leucine--tRNA ligase [Dehalococcoidia bacterium]MDW8009160.1 leucine--tRNA ligase [Chloroflexota bacterium]
MAERYNPRQIERKWQERWERDGLYRTPDDSPLPKFYFLTMLPYTSGDLHIGHWYAMAPSDAAARYRRMRGYNVLFPMGFDAFGLPAENAAIKHGIHPKKWTYDNIERMRRQLKSMGAMFDWSREVITCDPEYYRWNQWFFLKMYERGLAYRALAPANWCPSCQTVLANEQVLPDGTCERCGTAVTHRDLEQWFFRITAYAEELLDHSKIQWPEPVVTMQKNWIGRSEGVEIAFGLEVPGVEEKEIRVFTTRPDTIYGVTFMVLAPEHPLVPRITAPERRREVEEYIEQARRQTEVQRLSTAREKTGVFTGAYCRNLLSGELVPIFIADYALMWYGTGAVMGVPAHDQRDFEFARKFGLPVKVVVAPPDWDGSPLEEAYEGPGTMVDSGPFTGLPSEEGKAAVARYVEEKGWGRRRVMYRMRDWLISRQRYWGTPIPIVYCDACGTVPVPEEQLPIVLPEDVDFRPTGESPLARHEGFVNTACPRCGRPARRETDTMDTFMDSNWYFMRYLSPHYDKGPFDPELGRKWLPVDQYTGGAEHAVMHLLYARFFWKVCRDLGLVEGDEPFLRLFNQGQILGPDGQRMSKSRGNVVAPDEQVERWGTDTFRCYLMFLGPWEHGGPFTFQGIQGIWRWLNRVWNIALASPQVDEAVDPLPLRKRLHSTIQRATEDMEKFRFNTLIAALMELTNDLQRALQSGPVHPGAWNEAVDSLLLMLAPLAPHISEELWERRGRPYSIHQQSWPSYDPELARPEEVTLVIQVNGRLRDRLTVPADISEEEAKQLALGSERVRPHIDGRPIRRIVYVPGKLVNIVVG